jgi:hypothetical protein
MPTDRAVPLGCGRVGDRRELHGTPLVTARGSLNDVPDDQVRHVHTWGHPVRFSSLRPFTISEVFGPDDLVRGCMTCPEVVR